MFAASRFFGMLSSRGMDGIEIGDVDFIVKYQYQEKHKYSCPNIVAGVHELFT